MIYMILFGLVVAAGFGFKLMLTGWYLAIARILTPRNHRLMGSFRDTATCQELESSGYSVTVDWHSDAVARIDRN